MDESSVPQMVNDSENVFRRQILGQRVDPLPSGRLPARSPIEGVQVRIEPLDPELHASDLYQASHDTADARRIWDYLPWGPWQSPIDFEAWLRALAGMSDFIWYAFRSNHDGRAKGMACYLDIKPDQGVIEIGGIWFSPDMQRTCAATETLFMMMSYAMDDLRYRQLQWRCNALNERSRSAARRFGFRFEGIFYSHMIVKGHNRNTAWYAMTDDRWSHVKGNMLTWLYDDECESSLSDLNAPAGG